MADILCDTRKRNDKKPLIVIVTHGDADGLVSATIVKAFEEAMGDEKKNFFILSSLDVSEEKSEKLFDYIFKYIYLGRKDKLYILDRPIPSIGWLSMGYVSDTNVISIDHHLTNHPDSYKDNSVCKNIQHLWSDKKSAALLSLEWFKEASKQNENLKKLYSRLEPLAIATSLWDIFTWKNLSDSEEDLFFKRRALYINSAEKILGDKAFYKLINKNIDSEKYSEELFSYFSLFHEAYESKLETVYEFTKRSIVEYKFKNYKMAVVYGVDLDYQSIIADKIFTEKVFNYEIIAFVNIFGTVSFRSKGDIDISELAKTMGELAGYSGGGHKNAAGCKIFNREKIKEKLLEIFYENLKKC